MRNLIITLMFLNSIFYGIGQDDKINIALVSRLDTSFFVFSGEQEKILDIRLQDHWMEETMLCIDTTVIIIQWEKFPNKYISINEETNGLGKANKQLREWMSELHDSSGYDMIILITESSIWSKGLQPVAYNRLDSHSYGFNLKKNYGFSLVDVVLFDALTYKVLAVPHQQYMEGVITGSVGKKLKKNIEEISEDDLTHVVEKILNMDRKTVAAICEELRLYAAIKKYENRLKAAENNK